MFLLQFIFYFFLVIFLIGLVIRLALRFILHRTFGKAAQRQNNKRTSTNYHSTPEKKKIIDRNEGDYVDFEEVE